MADPTSSDVQSISGAPSPPPPLSGLLFGGGLGLSGANEPGGTGLAGGKMQPGMQAGPGLDILSLLSQLTQGAGAEGVSPNLGSLFGGMGGGFGGPGALGSGTGIQSPFFQQIGQQGAAGQTAGATGGTQGDVLSILKSLFSVGQKGTDLFSALQGTTPGTDLQTGTGQVGGYSLYGQPQPGTASPTVGSDLTGSLTGTNILSDPTLQLFNQGLLTGSLTPQSLEAFNTLPSSLQQQYANALFGGQIGPSLGESLQAGNTSGFNLGVSPLSLEGGGTGGAGSLFGNLGVGDVGAGLGALGGLTGLAGDIRSGNVGGTLRDLYGLYSQAAPYLSQATGTQFPTLGSFATQLGDMLGLGGAAVPAFGQGLGALAGATGSEIGSALASGGLAGGTAAAEGGLAAAGGGLMGGLGALGSSLSVLGAPLALIGLGASIGTPPGEKTFFGNIMGDITGNDPVKALNTMKEFQRNMRNIGFAAPIIQQGAGLPQAYQAALASGDPAQIAKLVEQSRYIMDQGPALSQVQPGIRGWGQFRNPFFGNEGFSQTMSRDMHNAFNTYAQGLAQLQRMGALTPYAGQDPNLMNTLIGPGGQPMFGGSSPVAPSSLMNMMGGDPFGYQQLYASLFGTPGAPKQGVAPTPGLGGYMPSYGGGFWPEFGGDAGAWSGASSAGVGPGSSSAGTY